MGLAPPLYRPSAPPLEHTLSSTPLSYWTRIPPSSGPHFRYAPHRWKCVLVHPRLGGMLHLDSQWTLPGPSATYRVVWWYDEAAKDTSRHVPIGTVMSLLRRGLRSYRLTLRRIDEALGGQPVDKISRRESDWELDQLGQRIAAAIRTGKMVVVRALPADASSPGNSSQHPGTPGNGRSVTVMVVDETGEVVPSARYRIRTGGSIREGTVDSQGEGREDNVDLNKLEITLLK